VYTLADSYARRPIIDGEKLQKSCEKKLSRAFRISLNFWPRWGMNQVKNTQLDREMNALSAYIKINNFLSLAEIQ
jgi:hypothetical protein